MKISLNWLKELVKIPDNITPEEIGLALTLKTVEVEGIERQGESLKNVVIGKINKIEKHPNADKLQLCSVDIGEKNDAQIVCGGTNLKEEMFTVVAKVGAKVRWHGEGDLVELEKAKIRGIESNGMICASSELGLENIISQESDSEIIDLGERGSDADDYADDYADTTRIIPGTSLVEVLKLDDVIFDIDNKSLTNRPDLWGHVGIAMEVGAIFGVQSVDRNVPWHVSTDTTADDGLVVDVQNQELCPRYMAVTLSGIKIGQSPQWIQNRLLAVGMRPINNIVDVTNYVMLELGQPMHSFNYQLSVNSYQLRVRNAQDGEKIVTLDGEERELDSEMLVIADGEKAIAIAGVMGGANSEIDEKTTDIILESANFEKVNNRQTATKLGLRTEAVMRYEKGLDPNLTEQALARCVELIQQMIPEAKISNKIIDIKTESKSIQPIEITTEYINKKIGTDISAKRVVEILESLGFGVKTGNSVSDNNARQNCTMQISVPSWRATGDVSIKEDIVEEVARIYGFDNIIPEAPKMSLKVPEENKERKLTYKIKDILKGQGMTETSNYSFVNDEQLEKMGINSEQCVEISNPISADSKFLRPNLIIRLLQNAKDNLRFYKEFSMFEIGSVFRDVDGKDCADPKCSKKLPWQEKTVAGIIVADKSAVPFYEAKETAESLMRELGVGYDVADDTVKREWVHPCRKLRLITHNMEHITYDTDDAGEYSLGYISEINPGVVRKMGIKNARVAVFEFSLGELVGAINYDKKYEKISKFPSILRDLAIMVNKKILVGDLVQTINTEAGKNLTDIELFDYYEGKQLEDDKKSLAFHLTFQSIERTLEDKEVDEIFCKITNKLRKEFKAELRK